MEYKMIAKTFMGLEQVLADELKALGAENVEQGRRVVSFTGDKRLMYKANFHLRTAIRILKPIRTFKASSADDVYERIKEMDWSEYLDEKKTFAVDSVVYSEDFRNSRFVTYKVKDAIVDWFREKCGKRPNISVANPDLRLNLHIAEDNCTLSLDSSGESLHRRGYRQETMEAPLNEVLAAGMIMMTGWRGETDFVDPMCGSGTILIEAALIAQNMAPGIFRKEYAFEKWPDFDREMFDEIYNDDSQEREMEHRIIGYDVDIKAVNTARMNIKAAGLTSQISVECRDFKDFVQPEEPTLIVTNPPYGERISTPNLLNTYKMIGERLKHQFQGNEAWVLSYREECFDAIGLKPSVKVPLYNGSLECEFRKYQMFKGKMDAFRSEGGVVKTDEEKEMMAERGRVKTNRDFKKRINEDSVYQRTKRMLQENEDDDIRNFTFHSLEREKARRERAERMEHREHRDRDERREGRGGYRKSGERHDRRDYGDRNDRHDRRDYGDRNDRHDRREKRAFSRDDRRKMFGGDRKFDKKRRDDED